ncbi:MAG: hypothetical protein Q9183_000239 [Haloplaca sp. 2 TL-2023]
MFHEPEAEDSKPVTKVDPTASARSSIRRQRSVRYPPHLARERHRSSNATSQHRHRERVRRITAGGGADHAYDIETAATEAHAEASRHRRLANGRAILRDALSYERPRGLMDMPVDQQNAISMMRPPSPSTHSSRHPSRPSRHRSLGRDAASGGSTPRYTRRANRTPPPAYIPSPPYTSGDGSDRSSPDVLQSAHGTASLTPRFAPAQVANVSEAAPGQPTAQHHPLGFEQLPASGPLDELPPLEHVSRRPVSSRSHRDVDLPAILDGLGDRWRSISPDDESWDTLLSTMPPDERLPSTSASSSFRSNDGSFYFQNPAGRAEDVANAMEPYPQVCEDSHSDCSETDDDAMRTLRRLGGESFSRPEERFLDNPPATTRMSGRAGVDVDSLLTGQLLYDPPATTRRSERAQGIVESYSSPLLRPLSGDGSLRQEVPHVRPQRRRSNSWRLRREMGRPSRERL